MDQNNKQWVYYNGELYHAGRLGMKWGKHLPGTDWWKETNARISSTYQPTGNAHVNKVLTNIRTAGEAAKRYGRIIKGTGQYYTSQARIAAKNIGKSVSTAANKVSKKVKYHLNAFKQDPKEYAQRFYKNKWAQVRSVIEKFYKQSAGRSSTVNSGTTLDTIVAQQLDGAQNAYLRAQSEGGVFNNINSVIETMEHNVVSGVNQFLKNNGWDDNVDRLLNKLKIKL